MDNAATFRISDVCGDPPFHFAKNEAFRLLEVMSQRAVNGVGAEIVLDFQGVVGISASGAQALIFGIVRRLGTWAPERVLFKSVDSDLVPTLEAAVANVSGVNESVSIR